MAQQYDVTLKLIFGREDGALFPLLFGGPVLRWHNIELPQVENKRLDLLAENAAGLLTYLEIDSQNDMPLPWRMVRNCYLLKDRFPDKRIRPVVLYVGKEPLRLPCPLVTEFGEFRYELIDARDLDGESLLLAADLRDNMLAILTSEEKGLVMTKVEEGLALMDGRARGDMALLFVLLGGLRDLEREIMERLHTMITMADLLANKVIGPVLHEQYVRGQEAGREAGERGLLRAMLEKRFGPLPPYAHQRLEAATERELTQWALAILSALDLDELLGGDAASGDQQAPRS